MAEPAPAQGGSETAERFGAHRVLAPAGALPQAADRLDATSPVRASELELDVELLNLDSTSHRQIAEASGGDAGAMAAHIAEIVAAHGKMHNPVTGSGGILVGRARAAGPAFPLGGSWPEVRVATLASLTLTPLRLDAVGPLDPGSPQIPVRGRAFVSATMPWAPVPDDLPLPVVLAVLDVYGVTSHVRDLAALGDDVLVLGAGRAGLLATAAAREAVGADGTVTVVDVASAAVDRAAALGARGVVADARDALALVGALDAAGVRRAALTVVVVNVPGCENGAVMATRDDGRVVFFSMATSFTRAALGHEGLGSEARLIIGSGYAPDRGAHALGLVRRHPALARAFSALEGGVRPQS
jgi:L-erythro-3,5-diaminohexanoate dehydrogenase